MRLSLIANPLGGRFNGPARGAWYASFARETSEREMAYHRGKELEEIRWQERETFAYVDFLADFRGPFHDLRGDAHFRDCLDANSYKQSQRLAAELLEEGSAGVVYPSVRHKGGTCVACFRPALVEQRPERRVDLDYIRECLRCTRNSEQSSKSAALAQVREEGVVQARQRAAAEDDGADGARGLVVGDANELAAGIFLDGHFRDDGNAHAGGDHAQDAAELAALENDLWIQTGAVAGGDGGVAETVAIAEQQERLLAQIFQRE